MSSETPPENTPDNELASIVIQLEDLVKLALAAEKNEAKVSMDSFVDVHKKLMSIYKMIESFRENYTKSLAALGLEPKDIQPSPEDVAELGLRDRKIYEKLGALQAMCQDAKERLHQSLQAQPQAAMNQIKEELKGPERKLVRRKDKFKGIGSKKGWIPS